MTDFFNYAQLIIGPAGSGKSTYCKIIQSHALTNKRTIKVINLDPAAENISYNCYIDIRDLINVEDVMEKKNIGPNGALVYCMDYINLKFNWLEDKINELGENTYFLIDCPGQLELYSHYNVMCKIIDKLKKIGVNVMSVFCLDSTFTTEYSKFISGTTLALASMIQLNIPHLNVLTKADLINNEEALESLRDIDVKDLLIKEKSLQNINNKNSDKDSFFELNKVLVDLLDNFSLVQLVPLNVLDEESINEILYLCDNNLQYFENQEPREDYYDNAEKILEDNQEYSMDNNELYSNEYTNKDYKYSKDIF